MADVAIFRKMAAAEPLPIDLLSYPVAMRLTAEEKKTIAAEPYVNGFRIAGLKHVLDGSIQGKTGFLGLPYVEPPKGGESDYRGYPALPAALFQANLTPYIERGVPMLIHSNGDAAIDMMLDGLEKALETSGDVMPDHRAVIIHAQMMREDQLDRAKKLNAIPSFFSAHPYYWGDWHRQILGEERASRISPIRSAVNKGLRYTIHNDAPVVPPHAMRLIWATVNRKTRSGYVLGADQKATVMEALYATTMGAAYQSFEEDQKGSITIGKQADLVILAENPLTVDPDMIQDIKILETISRGRTVFKAK
jgi:predicted amidohydrolase YtcJ